jgi:hypothetical protein
MKKEITPVGNNLPAVPKTADLLHNNELIAFGQKCRNKAGGPEMILIGFTTEPSAYLNNMDAVLTAVQLQHLAKKVEVKAEGVLYYCRASHLHPDYIGKYAENCFVFYRNSGDTEFYMNTLFSPIELYDPENNARHRILFESHGIKKTTMSRTPFYCICKYYSNKDEDFRHVLLDTIEVEFL